VTDPGGRAIGDLASLRAAWLGVARRRGPSSLPAFSANWTALVARTASSSRRRSPSRRTLTSRLRRCPADYKPCVDLGSERPRTSPSPSSPCTPCRHDPPSLDQPSRRLWDRYPFEDMVFPFATGAAQGRRAEELAIYGSFIRDARAFRTGFSGFSVTRRVHDRHHAPSVWTSDLRPLPSTKRLPKSGRSPTPPEVSRRTGAGVADEE